MRAHQQQSTMPKIKTLKARLQKEIFGQDEAIDRVVDKLMIHACGLSETEKPNGSFLFAGLTGVKKTELAKALATHFGTGFIVKK